MYGSNINQRGTTMERPYLFMFGPDNVNDTFNDLLIYDGCEIKDNMMSVNSIRPTSLRQQRKLLLKCLENINYFENISFQVNFSST